MKFILTHTYILLEDEIEQRIMKPYPPLGILYLSSFLKKNGMNPKVFDTTFSTYTDLIAYLDRESPEILGIHCNLQTKYTVMKLIRYCQEKNIISILGGPDASTQIDEFLKYGADIIISGEGEESLLTVLNHLELKSKHDLHDIDNVSFKTADGKIVVNPVKMSRRRLDDFPFPDRQAIDMGKYLDIWEKYHGQRSISIVTARGCAFTCNWCSHSVYGHTHRRRTPANVIEEIKSLILLYRPTHLWFADDVFTVNKRWLDKFQALMQKEHIYLPFECIGRADRLDQETVRILKKLNCYRIWVGAESGSQKILDLMSRGVSKNQIVHARDLCKQIGVEFGMFVMFGYPGEEIQDIQETIKFVRDLQPDQYLTTIAYPLRGTRLFEEIQERIVYKTDWTNHLQRELEIKNRFVRPLYTYAIMKTASEFRKRQLRLAGRDKLKQLYHSIRSLYCDLRIKRLTPNRIA